MRAWMKTTVPAPVHDGVAVAAPVTLRLHVAKFVPVDLTHGAAVG